jgi:multiple sugar transport system substrate-binding protein
MEETPVSGGVVMGNVPQASEPAVPPPESMENAPVARPPVEVPLPPQSDQPFVVPPAASSSANPFIPQVTPDAGQPLGEGQVSVPTQGNPMPKRLLMIAAFLVLLVLLLLGGKFVLGLMGSTKPVTLTYWGLWENDATVRSVLAGFEATHPKIKVVYAKQNPKQYRERLQAFISKGDGPDVFRFHNTWVPMLRNELAPAPKTGMTASEFSSTFYPVASADLVGGQSVYGLPMMIDGLGLYYNEDLFAAAGVTPPVTWEELLNIVPKLTVKNDTTILTSAIALGTTGNIENFSDILATMVMQNGAKLSVPTGKEAEEALVFYKKFANPSDPVYTWNDSMDNSIYAFASGKVAMIIAPSWRVFDIKQISPTIRFKVVPIPQLPGNTVTWATYWAEGVSAKSKNQEQAWELVSYMASKEAVTKMYSEAAKTRLFGEIYARVDLGSTIADDPYAGAYIKQAATAKSFPLASRTFDNGINDKLIKYFEDAVNAVGLGTAPAAALETASSGFRQVLGSFGLTTGSAPATTP